LGKRLYHVCAFAGVGLKTIWHDGMVLLPEPNLADGWLPRLREVTRDIIAVENCVQLPVEDVTIVSISRLD
jgi:hypothetical protein